MTGPRRSRLAALLAVWVASTILVIAQPRALADARAPRERLVEEARNLFIAATGHYQAGRLRAATKAFQASLALVDRPSTRFNLARTWQRLGQPRLAALEYSGYLAAYPDAPDRQEVRALVKKLRASTTRKPPPTRPHAAAKTVGPEPLPLPALGSRSPTISGGVQPGDRKTSPMAAPAASATRAQRSSGERLPAYAAFVTSGVAAFASAWFGMAALNGRDELSASSIADRSIESRQDARRLAKDIRSDALVADVLGATALTAAAAGVWMYLSPPGWAADLGQDRQDTARDPETLTAPGPAPTGTGSAGD